MILVIVGATGSGKTAISTRMANVLPKKIKTRNFTSSEIIGADAMQLYKKMDIGTAKISAEEMQNIPHHMIDCLEIMQEASVAEYRIRARKIIKEIYARKNLPILVGGSGLYIRSVIDKLNFPPTDNNIRQKYEQLANSIGNDFLYNLLKEKDSLAAEKINKENTRRLVRALEVIEISGKPYSATMPQYEYEIPALQIGIKVPNEILDEKLYLRSKQMFENGLVEETLGLIKIGLREAKTASKATGYAQTIAYIDGELTLQQAIEQTFIATRQLSRRQIKWFRKDKRVHWFNTCEISYDEIVDETVSLYEKNIQI